MATCYILWPFGNVVVIWYNFPRFGTFCQEKSGNPGGETEIRMSRSWLGSRVTRFGAISNIG
jgi:hypothetical protein